MRVLFKASTNAKSIILRLALFRATTHLIQAIGRVGGLPSISFATMAPTTRGQAPGGASSSFGSNCNNCSNNTGRSSGQQEIALINKNEQIIPLMTKNTRLKPQQ
jgi:hypothetical protein